jgi:hypothetical protein
MSKIQISTVAFIFILFLLSCKDTPIDLSQDKELTGSWILYERGYSPGAGYIIEKVPTLPPQIITFKTDNRISTTITGLTDFKFYLITTDSVTKEKVLALYENFPADDLKNPPDFYAHSYLIKAEGDRLKLYFRYCFEGCHLGLRRYSQTD